MPHSASIFAVPGLTQDVHTGSNRSSRKRKRLQNSIVDENKHEVGSRAFDDDTNDLEPIEYTAVLTPTERSQRRLAGQRLDKPPPPYPFPHKPISTPEKDARTQSLREDVKESGPSLPQLRSLRSQHLATLTSILHRCLQEKEYHRAGRALGLLLRNELDGKPIDIRDGGLWGIGAEILLNQGVSSRSVPNRESFERVKSYYDRLSIQYPPNRIWPDAMNAQDFKLALFGLWIFIINCESLAMQDANEAAYEFDSRVRSEVKAWELQQAEEIAVQMDNLMNATPYSDNPEFIRLRGMVALWIADLAEEYELFRVQDDNPGASQPDPSLYLDQAQQEPDVVQSSLASFTKAQDAREKARRMLSKLDMELSAMDEEAEDLQ